MNQHTVQKAYIKHFEDAGKVWVHNKHNETISHLPAKKCTIESDFQPYELEAFQNKEIEKPGIESLRKLFLAGSNISEDDMQIICYWTALHLLRNMSFREESEVDYIKEFENLFHVEKLFTDYYRYIYTYSCSPCEFFITSDNPIIEFAIGEHTVRVLSLSPSKAILFSPIDNVPTHQEVAFPSTLT